TLPFITTLPVFRFQIPLVTAVNDLSPDETSHLKLTCLTVPVSSALSSVDLSVPGASPLVAPWKTKFAGSTRCLTQSTCTGGAAVAVPASSGIVAAVSATSASMISDFLIVYLLPFVDPDDGRREAPATKLRKPTCFDLTRDADRAHRLERLVGET